MKTMNKIIKLTTISLLLGSSACMKDKDFLNVPSNAILTNEQAFSEPSQVLSILADLYNRQLDITNFDSWQSFADFSESFPSQNDQEFFVKRNGWGFGEWGTWDYGYIRDVNLFLERATAATKLEESDKSRFIAEGRFLRANFYFEMTKRMGGVPLILKSLYYELGSDPSSLQFPRAKESEMYDFVIAEAEAIKDQLPTNAAIKSRATKGAALAMATRAAVYAGSIAKYGNVTPSVTLPGGEVGIPADKANAYYEKALSLAKDIINGSAGAYALYKAKPDPVENFTSIFLDKGTNPEPIFVEDYRLRSGKVHYFTGWNQPRYGAEEEEGGRINPSLNLVQAFEKLDNTFAPLPIADGGGNPIFYNNLTDLFADRDPRLAATVILPGSSFKNRPVDIWAGVQLGNGTIVSGDDRGAQKPLPGSPTPVQVVGFDGPINAKEYTAQSGFYIRKYLDPTPGAGSRGTNSEVPFIRYRFAEVLLNAAEAAFELNRKDEAAGYLNEVRRRAGFPIDLTPAQITFDRIVHERRVELAFEGHILFDMKRWRLAHQVWDGNRMTAAELVTNIGKANKRSTQPWALWPYRYHAPGEPNHGKWLFKIVLPALVTGANNFQLGNYYSFISDEVRANNPKIVRQPNQ